MVDRVLSPLLCSSCLSRLSLLALLEQSNLLLHNPDLVWRRHRQRRLRRRVLAQTKDDIHDTFE